MFEVKDKSIKVPMDAERSCAGFELAAYAASDKGLKRNDNEDTFLLHNVNPFNNSYIECLLAVADGFGHDKRGKIASQMAVDFLRSSFNLPSSQTPMRRLVSSIELTNQRIINQSKNDFSLRGMSSTLTVAFIKNQTAYIAHVGDSRAYLIRDGQIRCLTKDQTLAQALIDSGDDQKHKISKSAFRTLLQSVGNDMLIDIWQETIELTPNDLILICSNGITAHLTDTEIRQIVEANAEYPEKAAKELIREANELSGDDNITVVVAQFRYATQKHLSDPIDKKKRELKFRKRVA